MVAQQEHAKNCPRSCLLACLLACFPLSVLSCPSCPSCVSLISRRGDSSVAALSTTCCWVSLPSSSSRHSQSAVASHEHSKHFHARARQSCPVLPSPAFWPSRLATSFQNHGNSSRDQTRIGDVDKMSRYSVPPAPFLSEIRTTSITQGSESAHLITSLHSPSSPPSPLDMLSSKGKHSPRPLCLPPLHLHPYIFDFASPHFHPRMKK